ncbi:MAG: glycerophosphodiester phosphodiesterase family protein, partial [Candidatus Binatia bacterium]
MASFHRALADGAGYLELDVHATRDGVVVVIHDPTVDRTTDGRGAVRELTFAELRELDAGFGFATGDEHPFRGQGIRVPALGELVKELPDVPLNIEIKQAAPPIEREVVALLKDLGALDRVMLAAEQHDVMRRIRSTAPGAATSFSAAEVREFFERCFGGNLDG